MGYNISNNMNLINYLPISTTQPHHLLLTHCTTLSEELGSDRNNKDFPTARTSRWNPTPEQITTLEEIYSSGIRTPTTEEIQDIALKLRKYGRIEGKNVFYWFQNHKARERLKRRRCEGSPTNKPHKDIKDSSSGSQHELVLLNDNRDNINVNDEEHGTTEKSERVSEDGKEATWRNLVTNMSITQEPGEMNMDDEYVNGEEEEEETREIRTLNLFPVIEKEEQTGKFTEMTKEQMCCNYCYFYEFMPLKN